MQIPRDILKHVESAPQGEARVAITRVSGTAENPTLLMVVNGFGVAGMLQMCARAVETAPTPEDKEAWRGLSLQITGAAMAALGPVE